MTEKKEVILKSVFVPSQVRPREGWVVVLADPRKEIVGNIILPTAETGIEKVTEGAGVLIRVGKGEKNALLGLEPGLRVFYRGFLKYANPIETEEMWGKPYETQKKTYFIMNSDDLLGVMPDGVEVGVFSGRPQVPEKA